VTTFAVLGLRPVCTALDAMGVDASAVLRHAGIDPDCIHDPDARVSTSAAFAVFERAVRETGDEAFGLRAATAIPAGALEVFDVAARSAGTYLAALERIARYFAVVHDGATLAVDARGDAVTIVHANPRTEPPPLAAAELLFALIVLRGRELTGQPADLRAVRFRHPAPRDRTPHDRFFGLPVTFGWPHDELEIRRGWLDMPLSSADATVAALVDRFLRTITAQLHSDDDLVGRVRRAIAETLSGGEPALETIAEKVAMSTRTLQRRLQSEHRSYADLLDDVRRELAVAHLAECRYSIAQVGYMLGFSEPSAFVRAFRRWTGLAPGEYRKARVASSRA